MRVAWPCNKKIIVLILISFIQDIIEKVYKTIDKAKLKFPKIVNSAMLMPETMQILRKYTLKHLLGKGP